MLTDQDLIAANVKLDVREAVLTRREQELSQRPPVKDLAHETALMVQAESLVARAREVKEKEERVKYEHMLLTAAQEAFLQDQTRVLTREDQVSSAEQAIRQREITCAQRQTELEERERVMGTLQEGVTRGLEDTKQAIEQFSLQMQVLRTQHEDRVIAETARLTSWEHSVAKREEVLTDQLANADSLPVKIAALHREAQETWDRATALEKALLSLQTLLENQRIVQAKIAEEQLVEAARLVKIAESHELNTLRLDKRTRDLKQAEEKAGLLADDTHG